MDAHTDDSQQPHEQVLEMRGGRARMRELRPGTLLVVYEGIADASVVDRITPTLDAWIARGLRVTIAVDAFELESYEPGFRQKWTKWIGDNKPHVEALPILFRSKLVQMGIALVNALTGGVITGFTSRADFERSIGRLDDSIG